LFAFGGLLMVVLGLAVRMQHDEQLNYDFTKVSKYIVKRVSLGRGATAQTFRKGLIQKRFAALQKRKLD